MEEEKESINYCAEGLEPHQYEINDMSGEIDPQVTLKCRKCGHTKHRTLK